MMNRPDEFAERTFAYVRSHDQESEQIAHYPVIVVGAGPVGLTAAIDLARQGVSCVLLDDDDTLATGSRAICFAKRTLDIWDRIGCGQRMVEKGVSWNRGKVFFRDELVYAFDLLAEAGYRRPAFINLQQYYAEGFLYDYSQRYPGLSIRWKNKVIGLLQRDECVELIVETPDGAYRLRADYVIAADGARSALRALMGLQSRGRSFKDRFLIADVKMKAEFPAERWFWFDPPFHPNQSVLLHMQPDNVWRIDFQLGWDADPVLEKQPERIIARVKALIGNDVEFELEWASVYTFSCVRMERFRHGRVLFAGDAAHGVSPFGARGANSGVQDADNLTWKLKLVLSGTAPAALLDTYGAEREEAADENLLRSSQSTDFITPKNAISKAFRDATLLLSKRCPFARQLINSGRLSAPAIYRDSPLNTPDADAFAGQMIPGAPCADAPIAVAGRQAWFLEHTTRGFTAVYFCGDSGIDDATIRVLRNLMSQRIPVFPVIVAPKYFRDDGSTDMTIIEDTEGLLAKRYDASAGTLYLTRPDQHICARWRNADLTTILAAVRRATCNQES